MNDVVKKALLFATARHAGVNRLFTNEPYIEHCIRVADMVRATGARDAVVAAALLHDVLEDTDTTADELAVEFGEEIARLVTEVTKVSTRADGNRAKRRALDREHFAKGSPDAQTIKLGDTIDNTRNIERVNPKFAAVYMPEKAALLTVLTKGNRALRIKANDIVNGYLKGR